MSILQSSPSPCELGHIPILSIPIRDIAPSPENDKLYRPVNQDDPAIRQLAVSIADRGILEPLVVSADHYIISGHRRHAAAILAGLESVPCRVVDVCRDDDPDQFVVLLREHNRQREKTADERLREEIVTTDPREAYEALLSHREAKAKVTVKKFKLAKPKQRARITDAKLPMLLAILKILRERRDFWPLSDRQIHYGMLNDPPLRHASKPDSAYQNDLRSYKSLCDILTRARLAGVVPMEAIDDETRPVTLWDVHPSTATFVRDQLDSFLKNYRRDLQQSQPNHIEIVGEKLTVERIISRVAGKYSVPVTVGRGYCSLPPRYGIAQRYRASGKEKLILLVLSDFDPDGEEIAHSLAASLRDDFAVRKIHPVKVALTPTQIKRFKPPRSLKAKETSCHYSKFVKKYGSDAAFELEAIAPEDLQVVLTEAIDSVVDRDALNHERDREREDAQFLEAVRRRVWDTLPEDLYVADGHGGDE